LVQGARDPLRNHLSAHGSTVSPGVLEECGGKIAEVARRAGMDRMSIYRIVQRPMLRTQH
jgi:transcriptional regulator of acetoin/glycerol metabolism